MSCAMEEQERIYAMLERLQDMATHIPRTLQQRLPNELLSSLSAALVQGQIFEIVSMLTEVQNAAEKQFFHQRLQLHKKMQDEKREFEARYQKTVCESRSDPDVLLGLSAQLAREKEEMLSRQAAEVKRFDSMLVLQLDQKVIDQQVTLEKAGVPGFRVTNSPVEIQVQMHLLDFIRTLGLEEGRRKE